MVAKNYITNINNRNDNNNWHLSNVYYSAGIIVVVDY